MSCAVIGEALIDLIAGDDGAFRPHLGGSPYNVAIALSRQGSDVSYLSPFSEDQFGDKLRARLVAESVRLPLERRSTLPTSLALVSLNEQGVPAYRLYRQGIADKDVSAAELIDTLPDGLKILHTGSLAITPGQLEKIHTVIVHARTAGAKVSVDLNLRHGASTDMAAYIEGVRALVKFADIVKASDEDLELLGMTSGARRNAETLYGEMGSGLFVLTEGGSGAVLLTGDGIVEKAAYRVERVVDTVGAGDTFHATFLAALLRLDTLDGNSPVWRLDRLAEALELACAAAAINVTRAGCSPPTLEETRHFIEAS